jgi:hypothetical protein
MVGPGGYSESSNATSSPTEDDFDDGIGTKSYFIERNKELLEANRKEERRLAKLAEHEAKARAHQEDKAENKRVAKLAKQQGKADAKAQRIANKAGGNQETHQGKGGGQDKKGSKGKTITQDSVDKTVNQKTQNDVDNKDLQRQTEDYIDYAVLGVIACGVLLFVYFASRR